MRLDVSEINSATPWSGSLSKRFCSMQHRSSRDPVAARFRRKINRALSSASRLGVQSGETVEIQGWEDHCDTGEGNVLDLPLSKTQSAQGRKSFWRLSISNLCRQ